MLLLNTIGFPSSSSSSCVVQMVKMTKKQKRHQNEDVDLARMVEMSRSRVGGWENLSVDLLLKICKEMNLKDLAAVSLVCRPWRLACSHISLWGLLDLDQLKSNFIITNLKPPPYVYVDAPSDRTLTNVLNTALGTSQGSVTAIIFHFDLYMKDEHLAIIASRCPHLKQLVLPSWDCLSRAGISEAMQKLRDLESLTMPSILHPEFVMEEIGRSCQNFSQLKVMGKVDTQFASAIANNIPRLKVLSMRCCLLTEEALLMILESMASLEVLNLSHCPVVNERDLSSSPRPALISWELERAMINKASRMGSFLYCNYKVQRSCTACQRMIRDEGSMRWYKYEDWFWRQDEVGSLHLGPCSSRLLNNIVASRDSNE